MDDSKKYNRESKVKRDRSIQLFNNINFTLMKSFKNPFSKSFKRNLINMTKLPRVFSNSSAKMS